MRLLPFCLLALLLTACASDPIGLRAGEFGHAASRRQCGPADGPAVSIYLAGTSIEALEPAPPYIRMDVWQPLERITERTWILSAASEDGGALYYSTAAGFEVATSGQLTVTEVAPDNTITGSAELHFPIAGRVRASFSAPWIPSTMLCG